MPKKLHTNPKAAEARQRKDTVKKEKLDKETKQKEDARWADEGTTATELRKKEKEAKKEEKLAKDAKKKELQEKETKELEKVSKAQARKMTQAQLREQVEEAKKVKEKDKEKEEMKKHKLVPQLEPEENYNQKLAAIKAEEIAKYGEKNVVDASFSIDNAIAALKLSNDDEEKDRHPERRMKAAFLAYEDDHLPQLKTENPSLKMTQLKEKLWKQWLKAAENPFNKDRV
eukprot:TRINITY_DN10491_c0_g1_i1.p1 TRINITY_DN10491_c0_g1~~TRINITY_DN10491_c0_g1_i1.p1  ORF type:complete len:229 (-),score=94.77 TRINITY_DN10491_c0_g1_i1:202-888(-)